MDYLSFAIANVYGLIRGVFTGLAMGGIDTYIEKKTHKNFFLYGGLAKKLGAGFVFEELVINPAMMIEGQGLSVFVNDPGAIIGEAVGMGLVEYLRGGKRKSRRKKKKRKR